MLSKYYLITNYDDRDKRKFIDKLDEHIKHGRKLIQLRIKDIPQNEFIEIARVSIKQARIYGTKIILNTYADIAKALNADGVHLTSNELMKTKSRPLSQDKFVSAACHNKRQLLHAESIGLDFVTLSPVLPTATHPDKTPLGWDNFSKLVKTVNLSVYALGGLTEAHLSTALNHGACGIAAIRALWNKTYP